MKRNLFILCIFITLIVSISHGNVLTLLARDDTTSYTLEDLNTYIYLHNINMPPFKQTEIIGNNNKINPLLERYIRSLAFRKLFVDQEIAQGTSTPEIELYVRDRLRNHVYQNSMRKLAMECRPTTPELEIAYQEQKEQFKVEERRKVAVLYKVFPDDEDLHESLLRTLRRLRERSDLNENFLAYVKENSDLPGASGGGIVDYFTRGTYGPIFEKYAFSTPKGEISPVFSATKGAYIIKCLDIKPAGYLPLSEVAKDLAKPLFEKKKDKAQKEFQEKLRKNNSVWKMENLPEKGSADLVLLKVNDYTLTSGTLFSTYPILTLDRKDAEKYLEAAEEREALFQEFQREWNQNPLLPLAREVNILRIMSYHEPFFTRLCQKEIQVSEDEVREYYDKNKGAYHKSTPKRMAYLLFRKPVIPDLPEQQFYKKVEQQYRDIKVFLEKVQKQPESFVLEAKALAKSRSDAFYEETGWIEALPQEWHSKTPIIEYSVGRISPILLSDKGFLVFQAIEQGKPEILPYEAVRNKAHSVIWGIKQKAFLDKIQEDIFNKSHFELVVK